MGSKAPPRSSLASEPLSPELQAELFELAVSFQIKLSSYHCQPDEARLIGQVEALVASSALGSRAWLALAQLGKSSAHPSYYPWNTKKADPSWYDPAKPISHAAWRWHTHRQSKLVTLLLDRGCPARALLSASLDPSKSPSAFDCGRLLCSWGSRGSSATVLALISSLAESEDREELGRGLLEGLRSKLASVWPDQPGCVNIAESAACQDAAPVLQGLKKLGVAIPTDLQAAAKAALLKASKSKSSAALAQAAPQPPSHPGRLRALRDLIASDDAAAVSALLPLCDLTSSERFAEGCWPKITDISPHRHWGSYAMHCSSFETAALLFDSGENPWRLAGDGPVGPKAEANPFLWFALHSSGRNVDPSRAGSAAASFVQAALREAASRDPSDPSGFCRRALETARSHPLWSSSSLRAPLDAACERALLDMDSASLARDRDEPTPSSSSGSASRRSRI